MKTAFKMISLAIVLILVVSLLPAALADYVRGSTSGAKTFYVSILSSDGYVVLKSYTGVANVAQHNALGIYTGDGNENHHGFYEVIQTGEGINRSFVWAPSATTNKGSISDCEEVKISFPKAGEYAITVQPLSNAVAAVYWLKDTINYWVQPAVWEVSSVSMGYARNDKVVVTEPPTVNSSNYTLDTLPSLSGDRSASITGSGNVAVYTGPGTNYYRSASGKAAVGAGETVTIYGRIGDWIMIRYNAWYSSKNMWVHRVAYIPDNQVDRGPKYGEIQFAAIPIWIDNGVKLADEPATTHYYNSFNSIRYNDAIALAQIYENGQRWIYFECTAESSQGVKPFRGFVPANYVHAK